ncbi:hypothetical protein BUALT_Bualt01G0024000 [Buddleja alternifolia]|uniref:Transmembrane protein n=1 Tax=Buddleja alternifolia TaxID=168488 RepID=A0AAV6Y3W9_9LAMI|nr:hypothetical protein BUALT_Bualt01G0024000 [Buddleja alternifolia]
MGWFVRERRGIGSWKDQTLDSVSAPPTPLMVFFILLIMLMYFEISSEQKHRVERKTKGITFGLLFLPLLVVLAVNVMLLRRRLVRYSIGLPRPVYEAAAEEGSSAGGLLLVLIVLLVMVYYKNSFQSAWFRVF